VSDIPKVSIIVPNFNHAKYLTRRMESIFKQSFQDFEVIALDDASSDNSLQILEGYSAETRLRIIANKENSGSPFRQWNKGIELARGEFIWIAESDDYADPGFLENLVNALDVNVRAGLAYCQSWIVGIDSDSTTTTLLESAYSNFPDADRWNEDFQNEGISELANYLVYRNTIPNASAVLFRKSVMSDGLRAPDHMRLTGDWMFWAMILLKSDLVFIARPLNYFREIHAGSQRGKTKRDGLDLIEGLEIYTLIERNGLLDETMKRKVLLYQIKLWASLACLRRLSWDLNRDIYHEILRVHPTANTNPVRNVLIPFLGFFLTAPIRSVKWIVAVYKRLRTVTSRMFKGDRDA
jgi:glycosyltransferase involved in cell wall biosynthesis